MNPNEIAEDEDPGKPLYTKQGFQLHRVLAGELVFDENKQRAVLLKKPRCSGNEGTYKLLLAQHTHSQHNEGCVGYFACVSQYTL